MVWKSVKLFLWALSGIVVVLSLLELRDRIPPLSWPHKMRRRQIKTFFYEEQSLSTIESSVLFLFVPGVSFGVCGNKLGVKLQDVRHVLEALPHPHFLFGKASPDKGEDPPPSPPPSPARGDGVVVWKRVTNDWILAIPNRIGAPGGLCRCRRAL